MIYRMVEDRSQVDDLAQDVFLKVHRGLPYFRGEARLSTWIYRIVSNECVQARSRRRERISASDVSEPAAADGAFADLEVRDRIEKAMAQLPDNYRFLVAAHYLEGVQYEALAEALNLPLGTVKTHLYRAKRQLRELLS
jgi:RNA polymerase sigma-70 factor (ECF subfamily)